jgi:hypothetical protein
LTQLPLSGRGHPKNWRGGDGAGGPAVPFQGGRVAQRHCSACSTKLGRSALRSTYRPTLRQQLSTGVQPDHRPRESQRCEIIPVHPPRPAHRFRHRAPGGIDYSQNCQRTLTPSPWTACQSFSPDCRTAPPSCINVCRCCAYAQRFKKSQLDPASGASVASLDRGNTYVARSPASARRAGATRERQKTAATYYSTRGYAHSRCKIGCCT